MRSRLLWLSILVLVPLLGFGYWRWKHRAANEAMTYETAAVDRGRVVAKVTASGTLSALVTVQVGSQVSGRLAELRVDYNSQVKKGDVLARIDPLLFDAAIAQAQANVTVADGNLQKARVQATDAQRQLARVQQLFAEHVITQADIDTADTAAKVAAAQVQVAEGSLAQAAAALSQAEVNLGYTTIVSPVDGVVISRAVDVGQTVAASLQAPTLFTIAEDLRKMQVDTSVAEGDIGKLEAGMAATFSVDAYPGERFRGSVRQIRNNAQTVQNVVTYDAVIEVANPELKLRPGMTANISFIYADKDDVLRLPNAALRFRPPPALADSAPKDAGTAVAAAPAEASRAGEQAGDAGGDRGGRAGRARRTDRRTVWVRRAPEATPVPVPIRIGVNDGSLTEVLEGELKPGDAVVTDASGGPAATRPAMPGGPRLF